MKYFLIVVCYIAAIFVLYLAAYVVVDIVELYKIKQLSDITQLQVFGICTIIAVLSKYRYTNKQKEDSEEITDLIFSIVERLFSILFFWGTSYFAYWFLTMYK